MMNNTAGLCYTRQARISAAGRISGCFIPKVAGDAMRSLELRIKRGLCFLLLGSWGSGALEVPSHHSQVSLFGWFPTPAPPQSLKPPELFSLHCFSTCLYCN